MLTKMTAKAVPVRMDAGCLPLLSHKGRVPGAAQREPEASDALQTRDRYTHRLRDGPGPAVHRSAIARAAPHPGHIRQRMGKR